MRNAHRTALLAVGLGVVAWSGTATASTAPPDASGAAPGSVSIGFITKFPVDFYDTMVDSANAWAQDHPEVSLVFAQGASATDDEGEINAIESMVTQGVQAIVITPTSPNVQDALQAAVDAGIPVILVDNDIPDWDAKTSVVATDNYAGGVLAGQFMAEQLQRGRHDRRPRGCGGSAVAAGARRRLQGGPR